MKSKRIFTLMLALVMTLSLAACGGSKQEEAPADNAGNGEAAGDTQDFGGAELAAMVMGTKVPCVLTSRGDSRLTKMYSIALACLAAR